MDRAGHFNRLNKRLRKTVRIVPWRDEWELREVGMALLSVLEHNDNDTNNDPTQQWNDTQQELPPPPPTTEMCPEEAFAMISVWKSRLSSQDGLPHAIDSTAALAQVYRRDSQRRIQRQRLSMMTAPNNNNNGVSVMELRLSYSASIVRCINGFADSLQQQRAMAASVSSLCGQLGIPSWLVDTRHESSHNALPNLEVLRLSASTLLEFMKIEFWIPRCIKSNTNDDNERSTTSMDSAAAGLSISVESEAHTHGGGNPLNVVQNNSSGERGTNDRSPIDCLVRYKACASAWATTRTTGADNNGTKTKGGNSATPPTRRKRKKKTQVAPPKTTILPYDPLFGEVALSSSDDDGGGDGDDVKDVMDDDLNLDKPVVNSFWGSSVGTNTNRYLLLDISKKRKNKGKEKKKPIQNNPKKRKGEKSPNDCAKLFVQSVSSPQKGYAIAIQYLVWGGIGGAPIGRGVLIPGSEIAFPATPQGVSNCWQRYSPLVHVVSRTWPGFAACMITHLVDCVISIEDSSSVYDKDNRQFIQRQELDVGSIRKLFFLYAWIRLILSQRFVAALDRTFSVKNTTTKNTNPLDLPLAQSDHLESLGYPLNSLLDRCRRCNDYNHIVSNDKNSLKSQSSFTTNSESMGTSRDIIHNLETILGAKMTQSFGYSDNSVVLQNTNNTSEPSLLRNEPKIDDGVTTQIDIKKSAGAMSLDEMEAMLLSEDNGSKDQEDESKGAITEASMETAEEETQALPTKRRPAWVRCRRWDACAIGTLPGFPS